jgi:hypothetical protein
VTVADPTPRLELVLIRVLSEFGLINLQERRLRLCVASLGVVRSSSSQSSLALSLAFTLVLVLC